jgi:hypothetical protein
MATPKRLALVLTVSLAWPLAWGQAQDPKKAEPAGVEVRPKWKVGERHTYERIKSRRRVQAGKESQSAARTPIEIEVVEAGPKGILLGWTYGESRIDDPVQAANPLVRRMADILKGFRVELELGPDDASIQGVRNWQELQKTVRTIVETLLEEYRKSGQLPPAALKAVEDQLAALSATREQVEGLVTREAALLVVGLGRTYRRDEPIEFDERLPSPLGGSPIAAKGRFALRSYDPTTGRLVVDWTLTIPPEEARKFVERAIREITEKAGGAAPPANLAETLRGMTIEDRGVLTLDAHTGWPLEVAHTRTMKLGETLQEDAIRLIRRDPGDPPAEEPKQP